MRCPRCGGRLIVKDSRKEGEEVLRRRQCLSCRRTVYTFESIDDTGYVSMLLSRIHKRELDKNVAKRVERSGSVGSGREG